MPATFKDPTKKVTDKTSSRVMGVIQKREKKKEDNRQKYSAFRAYFTNKGALKDDGSMNADALSQGKTMIKNVGKITKAGTGAGKTFNPEGSAGYHSASTGASAGNFIGAGAQFIETAVDFKAFRDKVMTFRNNREIVKDGVAQLQQEKDLMQQIVSVSKDKADCQSSLNTAKKQQQDNIDLLDQLKKDVTAGVLAVKNLKTEVAVANLEIERRGVGASDFLVQQKDGLVQKLSDAEQDLANIKQTVIAKEKLTDPLARKVETTEHFLDLRTEHLQSLEENLGESRVTNKLKLRMARKDGDAFVDSLDLEGAKLLKSVGDSANALGSVISTASKLAEVAKPALDGINAVGGVVGIASGLITAPVNAVEFKNDVKASRENLRLHKQAKGALTSGTAIDQSDGELLAIAERLSLKQKKGFVDKAISANKNFFGALGGGGSIIAGTAVIMTAVGVGAAAASVMTPVGWALAGAAAATAIGYGCYKLARHLNSQAIKQALQTTIQLTEGIQNKDQTIGELKQELKAKIAAGPTTPQQKDLLKNGTPEQKKQVQTDIDEQKKEAKLAQKQLKALDKVGDKALKAAQEHQTDKTVKLNKDDLTVGDLQNYSTKKLLARDTGVATAALYARFKEEVKADLHLKDGEIPTLAQMKKYVADETLKPSASSAVSLLSKLGVGMKADEALDLYRDKDSAQGVKFLSKKIYSAEKPEKHSVRQDLGKDAHGPKLDDSLQQKTGLKAKVGDMFKRTPKVQPLGGGQHLAHS